VEAELLGHHLAVDVELAANLSQRLPAADHGELVPAQAVQAQAGGDGDT